MDKVSFMCKWMEEIDGMVECDIANKSFYHLTDQMHYTQRETIGFVLHTALNNCSSRSCMFADEFVITSGLGGSSGSQ